MKKIIKIIALMLALICIGTCLASCGSDSSIGGGLIPEKDKSETIGVGARVYVQGKDLSGATPAWDFTIDKTTNSTEEFLAVFEKFHSPHPSISTTRTPIFEKASIEEGNCLKIDLGVLNGYSPYELLISITLPEKIKKVTLTCREAILWDKSGKVIENFGTLSEDKKTLSFVGKYDKEDGKPENNEVYGGTLRIYY